MPQQVWKAKYAVPVPRFCTCFANSESWTASGAYSDACAVAITPGASHRFLVDVVLHDVLIRAAWAAVGESGLHSLLTLNASLRHVTSTAGADRNEILYRHSGGTLRPCKSFSGQLGVPGKMQIALSGIDCSHDCSSILEDSCPLRAIDIVVIDAPVAPFFGPLQVPLALSVVLGIGGWPSS